MNGPVPQNEKAAAAQTAPVKQGFIDVFLSGSKKGINIWLHALLPGVVFGYCFTQILTVTGIMTFIGNICAPIMAIFGLPGEAMACFVASFFSLAGACASAAALAAQGVMNAAQATILLPMLICVGSVLQFTGRMLAVADVPSKKYWVNCVIALICSVISGLAMRVIV